MAEKKPAAETWAMLKGVFASVCGEKERTRDLPTSYPYEVQSGLDCVNENGMTAYPKADRDCEID